ncbi:AMP-binding protein [uncultured Gulosibacter sp.]|uniref:AMP-binding protein n=1 Tax=uncultured Gulosibacter sp. TaxID=1339167 RepID=UPI00288B7C48|nr:AMP-binding protein [uncultured Gulosibacter sp.]
MAREAATIGGPPALREIDSRDVSAVMAALREALAGGAPVLPRDRSAATSDAVTSGADASASSADPADGDIALVIETSGSTGTPKRVALSAAALRASAAATYRWCDARAGKVPESRQWLLCLPTHYIAGAQVLVRSILAKTQPVVLEGRFTADAFVAAAKLLAAAARYTSLVPVQLQRLLGAAADDTALAADIDRVMQRFSAVLVGGQQTPPAQLAAARERGWPVVTTYGASETAGGCVYNGEPLPGVRVREVAGEIWLGGDQLALGYLGDPERQARTFVIADGVRWYRTSDYGRVSEVSGHQQVEVLGRIDQVIISGGEKVHLGAVERAVQAVPRFEQAVAVPVAHPEWGQSVGVVVPNPAAPAAAVASVPAAVRDACAPLGRAARVALLVELPALPRLSSGKPDRQQLERIAGEHADFCD